MNIERKADNVSLYAGVGADEALSQVTVIASNNGRRWTTGTPNTTADELRGVKHVFVYQADAEDLRCMIRLAAVAPDTHFHLSQPT